MYGTTEGELKVLLHRIERATASCGALVLKTNRAAGNVLEPYVTVGSQDLVDEYLRSVNVSATRVPLRGNSTHIVELWQNNPANQRVFRLVREERLLGLLVLLYDTPHSWTDGLFVVEELIDALGKSLSYIEAVEGNQQLEAMLNSTIEGVALLDQSFSVVMANDCFSRTLRKTNCFGRVLEDLIPITKRQIDELLLGSNVTVALRRTDCSLILDVNLRKVAVASSLWFCVSLRDVTQTRALLLELETKTSELMELNAHLRQARDAEAEFLSMVTHELRNPLNIIVNGLELLAKNTSFDKEADEDLAIVLDASAQLNHRIGDLLTIAQLRANVLTFDFEPVDIIEILTCSVRCFSDDRVSLVVPQDVTEVPIVTGDPRRLRQLFENLIDNARKYGSGSIRVSMGVQDGELFVEVANEGDPIPEYLCERVLEPFIRNDKGVSGLGLGLAIAKGIALAHGGDLRVRSKGRETLARFSMSVKTMRW